MNTSPKKGCGDPLNVERTALANERTLLAYIRTALAFLITGASALHFIDKPSYRAGGVASLVIALLTAVIGFVRYLQVRTHIQRLGNTVAGDDED